MGLEISVEVESVFGIKLNMVILSRGPSIAELVGDLLKQI